MEILKTNITEVTLSHLVPHKAIGRPDLTQKSGVHMNMTVKLGHFLIPSFVQLYGSSL